ncbi:prephenate dehydrogenase [Methanobacterium alcaliphilum]|uniref:prephenate dehydrogenase n=1 Tax=Methanobacterium alcaliphilum TaxID=392018 RepID=UPI00200A5623|nr:prephenate dehydrogenase [Methanobacterium alcaliphilum]MCK9152427.1 prephenate dehydrogenase [Methanobacterium alcaliphilum]
MKIAIIGGTRGLGEWIAHFLKEKGKDITITGRDKIAGQRVSQKLGVNYCCDNKKVASDSDVVIIAVPIENTESVICEISPLLKKGSLLVDVTSIKEKPSSLMQENVPEGVEFLPTHPMFGPRTLSLDGQVVVLTPPKDSTIKKSKWFKLVLEFLEKNKARVLITTPQKHDEMMSVVQVLTHFAYISIASTIEKLDIDIKDSRKFASPIYSLMLDIISRIVAQNPYLAYSIQTQTEYANKARNIFLKSINDLNLLLSNKDQKKFVKAMSSAAKNMDDLDSALGRSDKALTALNHELNVLKNSINMEVGLKHIYSGKVHLGILKDISPDFVTLNTGKNTLKLKTANIKVLDDDSILKWKLKNLKHLKYDVSAIFPITCDPHIIASTIEKINGVIKTSVIDVYQGKQVGEGKVSVTFHFEVFDKEIIKDVEHFLEGLGAVLR